MPSPIAVEPKDGLVGIAFKTWSRDGLTSETPVTGIRKGFALNGAAGGGWSACVSKKVMPTLSPGIWKPSYAVINNEVAFLSATHRDTGGTLPLCIVPILP